MNSIGASTMDSAVVTTNEQQYLAGQLNMLKHQSRLTKEHSASEQDRKQIQKQTLANRQVGKLDYDFSNNQAQGGEASADEAEDNRDPASDLKQAKAVAKKQQAKAGKEGVLAKAISPFRKLTSSFLRSYWRYLIPSYGLSLLGIGLHGFGGLVLGNSSFVKYGHEWVEVMKGKAGNDPTARQAADALGNKIGLLEKMLIAILDSIVIAAIFVALVLLVAVTMALFKPWWAVWAFLSWLYDMVFA